MKRIALVVAFAAGLFAAVPAQPAAAGTCNAEPHTPFMIDHKIEMIDGANRAWCANRMVLLISQARLQKYVRGTATWEVVAHGRREEKDTSFVWADAYVSCAGMGYDSKYRTAGHAQGISSVSNNFEDGWDTNTYWRSFNCSGDIQHIKP